MAYTRIQNFCGHFEFGFFKRNFSFIKTPNDFSLKCCDRALKRKFHIGVGRFGHNDKSRVRNYGRVRKIGRVQAKGGRSKGAKAPSIFLEIGSIFLSQIIVAHCKNLLESTILYTFRCTCLHSSLLVKVALIWVRNSVKRAMVFQSEAGEIQ